MEADVDLRAERDDAPEARPDRKVARLVLLASVLVGSALAAWLWTTRADRQQPAPAPVVKQAAPAEPAPAARAAASAQVQHPVPADMKPLQMQEIASALGGLLGTKAVSTFLQTDGFARRFAATVDSLAREHSPTLMWPVLPTPGRFLVQQRQDGPVIAPENAARYRPLVQLAGAIDVPAATQLYRRMYPLLQQAYRELGFGDRYLNDRVVQVIDVLLATPEVPESPRLELLPVKGSVPSLQPWVRYQFSDPQLEALSAGQKILVRVGPANQRLLKSKLAELRKELVRPVVPATGSPATAAAPGTVPTPPVAR